MTTPWSLVTTLSTQAQGVVDPTSGVTFSLLGPIVSTGVVGILLAMILLGKLIVPAWIYESLKKEQSDDAARHATEIDALKKSLKEATDVYVVQVIPTLTRVFDAERELVELRRDEAAERRRNGLST